MGKRYWEYCLGLCSFGFLLIFFFRVCLLDVSTTSSSLCSSWILYQNEERKMVQRASSMKKT